MKKPICTIIIPTLNEGNSLPLFLKRLFKLKLAKKSQIIVVDGGSTDHTRDTVFAWKARKKNIEWVECPRGKGLALRIGFRKAKAEKIIYIDADLQYPPEAIPKIAKALGKFDLVLTCRKSAPFGHRRILSLAYSLAFARGLLGLPASDPQSGLKGIRKSLLSKISLDSRYWELDTELIYKAAKKGAKIAQIPIEYSPRVEGKTKTGILGTSSNLFAGALRLAKSKYST